MFELELFICIKMDLALNNLQSLIRHKTQQPTNHLTVTLALSTLSQESSKRYISTTFVYALLKQHTLNINRSNKIKWFHSKKTRSRSYPTETMTDTNYVDDPVFHINMTTQAKSFLHSLKRAEEGIGLYVNANKMCFNSKWQASKISRPVHIPQQQRLIYWKWCQHTSSEGVDCYWWVIDH